MVVRTEEQVIKGPHAYLMDLHQNVFLSISEGVTSM